MTMKEKERILIEVKTPKQIAELQAEGWEGEVYTEGNKTYFRGTR